jgi:hypothetical protein
MCIVEFCETELRVAEGEIATERLAGNIVKEEHWKGKACAYRAVLAALKTSGAPAEQTGNSAMVPCPDYGGPGAPCSLYGTYWNCQGYACRIARHQ